MQEKIFIKDFEVGQKIDSYFVVETFDTRTKNNGDTYLTMTLVDGSGSVKAVAWDNVDRIKDVLNASRVVRILAMANNYNGIQLTLKSAAVCKEGTYELKNLIKSDPESDEILEKIKTRLSQIENQWLLKLIDLFLNDEEFMKRYVKAPGGWKWHHAYVGGMMRHSYEIMQICDTTCDIHKEADRDLCAFGGFVHDMGKIYEMRYDAFFEYTDLGKMVGHIILGNDILIEKINQIPDFPSELKMHLQHMLLSHQGEYEQRSPVLPQTLEACILYHADNLDSQSNAFKSVTCGPRDEGQSWSKWFPIINRQLKLGEYKDEVY